MFKLRIARFGMAAGATALLFIACSVSLAQGPRVTDLRVEVNPAHYTGSCPGIITFTAKITVSGPCHVRYRWIRSDAARAPVQEIVFNAAGQQEVTTTWTLGGPGLRNYNGWEAIRIYSPTPGTSSHANFDLHCSR